MMPDAPDGARDQADAQEAEGEEATGPPQAAYLSHLRPQDPRPRRMVGRGREQAPLLGPSPRRDAAGPAFVTCEHTPDLGDLVVILLASTLAGLRDRLFQDGFESAAELVADLAEVADDYLTRMAA